MCATSIGIFLDFLNISIKVQFCLIVRIEIISMFSFFLILAMAFEKIKHQLPDIKSKVSLDCEIFFKLHD